MSEKYKEIIEDVNASFAENNLERFLAQCVDDVKWTMVGEMTTNGKDDIRRQMAKMDSEPPKITTDKIIVEGEFATAHGDMTMKDKDGKTVSYSFCDIYRFRDDKIAEIKAFVVKTERAKQAVEHKNSGESQD